jgi:HEAT repeat protein/lysophospholipase L1-like esterase
VGVRHVPSVGGEGGGRARWHVRLKTRLVSLAPNVLLSAVTVVVFLGGAEGLARLLERGDEPAPVAPSITDWALWEGDFYTVKATALGWPPFEDYNHDGLRDREHQLAKPPGVRRVICLGDSTTAGYRIRPQEAYPQVLQDLLDALGERTEVFNVALGGWSTLQERIAYRQIARKYGPDEVLVGVCLNDIPELGNNLGRPPAWLGALHRRSALVRLLVGARHREIRDVEELFQHPDAPRVKRAYEHFFEEVRALRDEVGADGARLGLLIFPFGLQVAPDAPPPLPQHTIAAFCTAEDIPFLDLLPAVRAAGPDAFVDYDHFSPLGSQVVADQIEASGLIRLPEDVDAGDAVEAGAGPAKPGASPGELAADLTSPDPRVRARAARLLGARGASARPTVPSIAARLDDPSAAVRVAAVWALGRIGPRPGADLPALVSRLEDEDPAVRAGAAWALGRLETRAAPAQTALVARLRDPEPEVRRRAVAALQRLRPDPGRSLVPVLAILEDARSPGRAEAARVVGFMGAAAAGAVPALVSALGSGDPRLRREAISALGSVGPGAAAAVPALVRALDDPDLRWRVPDALGEIGPGARRAVPALREALHDANATVRWRAALALGKMGDTAAAAAPDLARLVGDTQENVRLGAVIALAKVGGDVGLQRETFTMALRDPDAEVRTKAANGLGRLGRAAAAAVPALVGALADPDAWVRASAADALGHAGSGSAEAREALQRALDDEEEMVREQAAVALQALSSGPPRPGGREAARGVR